MRHLSLAVAGLYHGSEDLVDEACLLATRLRKLETLRVEIDIENKSAQPELPASTSRLSSS